MKGTKQKQLFAATRAFAPVQASPNFPAQVLSAIQKSERAPAGVSLFEQLNMLFPRLAVAALVVITVALAFQVYAAGDIANQLAEASDEWLLPLNWL
jgi:hypothetical protein